MNYSYNQIITENEKYKITEEKFNKILDKNHIYIARFDGVHMAKKLSSKSENKKIFQTIFSSATEEFIKCYPQIKFGYCFSDEISIILEHSLLNLYNYRIEKILSVLTSKLTSCFIMAVLKKGYNLQESIPGFDCRILSFQTTEEVTDYFISRQAFCIINHLYYLRNNKLIKYNLTNSYQIIGELNKIHFNYYTVPVEEKYGFLWINKGYQRVYEFKKNSARFLLSIKYRKNWNYKKRK